MSHSGPVNYPEVVFKYDPSKPVALVAGSVNIVVMVLLSVRLFRRKDWWGLCLPIGTLEYSIGFFLRFASAKNPTVFSLFVTNQLLIVVPPATFLAFNYITCGRLISTFTTGRNRYSLIRPEKVARVFIISDIATFIVQGCGGGLEVQQDTANAGRIILLVGIIVQGLSYVIFWFLLIRSHRMFRNDEKFDKHNFPWRLMHVLHISSAFIIMRATYRTIEFAQGNEGYLHTHEVTFYTLDTVPLFFAIVVYTYFWPGALIEDVSSQEQPPMQIGPVAA